jgi:hypothetical protein
MDSFDFDTPQAEDGIWYVLGLSARKMMKNGVLGPKKEKKWRGLTAQMLKKKDLA